MNSINNIVIFCIVFYYVKSHRTSEALENIYDESNEKLRDQESKVSEDYNDDAKDKLIGQVIAVSEDEDDESNEKLHHHNGAVEDDRDGDSENTNQQSPETSEDRDDEVPEKDDAANDETSDENYNADQVNGLSKLNKETVLTPQYDSRMEKDLEAGDAADLFGTNQHYNIPVNYQDFGRRFVLTYPYVEKNILNDAAEAELDNTVKKYLELKTSSYNKELAPIKAPPELVLKIAKQSALLEASKPINPTNEVIQKDILRTGEYWDDVWKEEVDVDKILRSSHTRNKFDSITVKISPGSKLHKLISILKQRSPRFLYVINKNIER